MAFQRQSVAEVMQENPVKLLRALVPIEDVQAKFQIVRMSVVTYVPLLLCILPPSAMRDAAAEYKPLLGWVLASAIVGEGARAAGLASQDDVRLNLSSCMRQGCSDRKRPDKPTSLFGKGY